MNNNNKAERIVLRIITPVTVPFLPSTFGSSSETAAPAAITPPRIGRNWAPGSPQIHSDQGRNYINMSRLTRTEDCARVCQNGWRGCGAAPGLSRASLASAASSGPRKLRPSRAGNGRASGGLASRPAAAPALGREHTPRSHTENVHAHACIKHTHTNKLIN